MTVQAFPRLYPFRVRAPRLGPACAYPGQRAALARALAGDTAIRATTAAVVVAVATFAAVVSYSHIYDLGRMHGQSGAAARLLPLSVDGLIAAASLVLLHEARNRRSAPLLARLMLGLGVAATVAANVAYGLPFGWVGAVVSAWPAVAFIGSVEMVTAMVRSSRDKATSTAGGASGGASGVRSPAAPEPALAAASEVQPAGASAAASKGASEMHPQTAPAGASQGASVAAPGTASEGASRSAGRGTRTRSRGRKTVSSESAEMHYAAELAAGQVPSARQIQRELHVGQDRAKEIHQHLTEIAAQAAEPVLT